MPEIEDSAATSRDSRFKQAVAEFGPALERLARVYEADAEVRRDLLQEILVAVWRSLEAFNERCSLRTWVYRVAHNTAASHVTRQMRKSKQIFVGLDELTEIEERAEGEASAGERDAVHRLYALIEQLVPIDRQVMLAYLEGTDAASTAEITGLSPSNVAVKIHRIKQVLARRLKPPADLCDRHRKGGA